MWQNGFSIDDGPLRAYNDQENRDFLTDVMNGRIPRELIREARGGEVMVNMEDHKDKPFEQPKVIFDREITKRSLMYEKSWWETKLQTF